jgi:hypothetical protein
VTCTIKLRIDGASMLFVQETSIFFFFNILGLSVLTINTFYIAMEFFCLYPQVNVCVCVCACVRAWCILQRMISCSDWGYRVMQTTRIPLDVRKCLIRVFLARSFVACKWNVALHYQGYFCGMQECLTAGNRKKYIKIFYILRYFPPLFRISHFMGLKSAQYALRIWKSINMATRKAFDGGYTDIWFAFCFCTYM